MRRWICVYSCCTWRFHNKSNLVDTKPLKLLILSALSFLLDYRGQHVEISTLQPLDGVL